MAEEVIVGCLRCAFTFAHKGELSTTRPDTSPAELARRSGVTPIDIKDLISGCAFPEGEQGLDIARVAATLADPPQWPHLPRLALVNMRLTAKGTAKRHGVSHTEQDQHAVQSQAKAA